jgi:nitroreductase
MDLREALRSTGAARSFTSQPVDPAVLYDLLDTARFAPNGGNRQGWRVVVVQDAERKRRLRDLYLPGWYEYLAQAKAGLVPWAPVTDDAAEAAAIAQGAALQAASTGAPGDFAEQLDEVPVLLLLVADLRRVAALDKDADHYTFIGGGSIYPFAWSILLAARDQGLGGVLTTMVARREQEIRELFNLEPAHAVAGVLALGYPAFQPTKLSRAEVEAFATVDAIDGPAFTR